MRNKIKEECNKYDLIWYINKCSLKNKRFCHDLDNISDNHIKKYYDVMFGKEESEMKDGFIYMSDNYYNTIGIHKSELSGGIKYE